MIPIGVLPSALRVSIVTVPLSVYFLYEVKTLSVINYSITFSSFINVEPELYIKFISVCSYKDGFINLGVPSLNKEIVAKARPTMISKIGKRVSIPNVFLSLICIRTFFLVRALK